MIVPDLAAGTYPIHRLCLVSNTVVALLVGPVSLRGQQASRPAVDAMFADLTTPGSPGCALGVYRDGKIVYAKGYGLANVEERVPITPQTVFDIGSVSKQFTAASILLLERQGKVRLDDDVRTYVPELPDYSGRRITILQLLNHTSGVRDYATLFLLSGINLDNVTTNDDALGIIARQRALTFAPGSDWEYSNSGYMLLSLVVQRVSGKTLKDFEEAYIFRPLEMVHTVYRNDHTLLIPHRALAYDPSENGGYKLSVSYAEETGDGMVQTSIEDLQKWDENYYSERVGGHGFTGEMEERSRLNDGTVVDYAKGLEIGEYRGLRTVLHSGGSGGYHAYLVRFPEQHFSVACLCNLGGVNRAKRVRAVADLYLGRELHAKPRAAPRFTAEQLKSMTGVYQDLKREDAWRVSERDGKLWMEFEGSVLELRALTAEEFEPVPYPMPTSLRFEPAQAGNRPHWIIDTGSQLPERAEAIDVTIPSGQELTADAGDYWSDELRVTYRLTVRDGKLWLGDLIGADGISHPGTVPFDELRPLSADAFDLKGAPIVFHFRRDENRKVIGFTLNGLHEPGLVFLRATTK